MLSTVQTTLPVDSQILLLIRGVLLPFHPHVNSLFFNCNFEYNGLFLAMLLSIVIEQICEKLGNHFAIHLKIKLEG